MTGANERYQRQLPLIGEPGQNKLSLARVMIAGMGGLGSTIATFLAVAGVGYIRIVDEDRVERNNLNRQIVYSEHDLGMRKVDIARERLLEINPDIEVEARCAHIDEQSIGFLIQGVDIILDGMDNFSARYVLNRGVLTHGIPLIHGAVNGFYGQASTIIPGKTPCLRCIIPHPPSAEKVPIIGATCGVIGSIQVMEAVKYFTGYGELLTGRFLLWDGLRSEAAIIDVSNEPECSDCGSGDAAYLAPVKKG